MTTTTWAKAVLNRKPQHVMQGAKGSFSASDRDALEKRIERELAVSQAKYKGGHKRRAQ